MSRYFTTCYILFFTVIIAFSAIPLHAQTQQDSAAGHNNPALCKARAPLGEAHFCREALAADPGDSESRRHLARALLIAGDHGGSVAAYRQVAEENPEVADAQFDLAAVYATLNDFKSAAPPLRRALSLAPAHRPSLQLAVILHQHLNQLSEAFDYIKRLAELGDDRALHEAGVALEHGHGVPADHAAAVRFYTKAAHAGHIGAMERLQAAYEQGQLSLTPDLNAAGRWAVMAAEARQ